MRGPTPKDPDSRNRKNKASTAAVLLEAGEAPEAKPPTLPSSLFGTAKIHRLTRSWWKIIWRSPMAPRWLEADVEGLYLVAILRNQFFHGPTPTLAAEIRQQETRFGLTPIDRRRLDWRIEGPRSQVSQAAPVPDAPPAPSEDVADPRRILRAVN